MGNQLHARWQGRAEGRRRDWASDGVLSGFVATFAMSVLFAAAYGLTGAIGDPNGGTLARWLWALAHNPMTTMTRDRVVPAIALNLLMGLLLGLIYGRLVEPMLGGRGWRKGVVFSLLPGVLSVVAVLPVLGGGFLGLDLGAGPLPILGNLVLHLVYGAVLGSVYAIALEAGQDDTEVERLAAAGSQRGAAIGVGMGVLAGFGVGWMLGPELGRPVSRDAVALGGALIGAAFGLAAGSLFGMGGGVRVGRASR